jgi:hypothetical protein
MVAAEFYESLFSQLQLSTVRVSLYQDPPTFESRADFADADVKALVAARSANLHHRVGFLEYVVAGAEARGELSEALIGALSFHQDLSAHMTEVSLSGRRRGWLKEFARQCIPSDNLSLLSKVDVDGRTAHLPMLDFSCSPTRTNARICAAICEHVFGCKSVVLDSGKSFHGVGTELVSAHGRVQQLALALQFAPIVDRFYISHQLRQGFSALRVSGGGTHKEPSLISG